MRSTSSLDGGRSERGLVCGCIQALDTAQETAHLHCRRLNQRANAHPGLGLCCFDALIQLLLCLHLVSAVVRRSLGKAISALVIKVLLCLCAAHFGFGYMCALGRQPPLHNKQTHARTSSAAALRASLASRSWSRSASRLARISAIFSRYFAPDSCAATPLPAAAAVAAVVCCCAPAAAEAAESCCDRKLLKLHTCDASVSSVKQTKIKNVEQQQQQQQQGSTVLTACVCTCETPVRLRVVGGALASIGDLVPQVYIRIHTCRLHVLQFHQRQGFGSQQNVIMCVKNAAISWGLPR